MDHVMRRVLVVAATAMLAGCSLFSDTQSWTKPGVTAEEVAAKTTAHYEVAV